MKKTSSSSSGGQGPRRGRRAIQYALLTIGALVLVNALVGDKGLVTMLKARRQYQAVEALVAAQRAANTRMREEARRLREVEPSTIEEIARRELGLIKPGEKLFIIKDVEPGTR